MTGTVARWDDARGFGFITPIEGGADYFVHYSCIEGDGYKKLKPGQTVRFQTELGPKDRLQATAVQVID